MSYKNSTDDRRSYPSDLEVFLRRDTPAFEVTNLLRSQGKSSDEIENTMERLQEARERINKVVRKFLKKVDDKLAMLDIPDRVRKGMRLADRYNLNDIEKAVLRKQLLDSAPEGVSYTYLDELKYTDMAKFLGFDPSYFTPRGQSQPGYHYLVNQLNQKLQISPKDQSKMGELTKLFEESKFLYRDVKNQSYMYQDVGPAAVMGTYDVNKHNSSIFIHPVVAALFIPKIDAIDNRMIVSNIARMVISRAQSESKDKVNMHENLMPNELENELEFAYAIATDPNSLEYFTDSGESPVENLIKRFRIQIELWKNVLNLRKGKYYASGYDDNDSGITGLTRILSSYEWAYFDSPDLYSFQDEGTVLRKLLAVFSMRPTFVQLSSYGVRSAYGGYGDFAKTSLIQIPIINVRLPNTGLTQDMQASISLRSSLNQADWVMEHKVPVPKNKEVIQSNNVVFFYAHRHNAAINFANVSNDMMRFQGLPASLLGQNRFNEFPVDIDDQLNVGTNSFFIRSVVLSGNLPFNKNILIGNSAFIIKRSNRSGDPNTYLFYNPQAAGLMYDSAEAAAYKPTRPITWVPQYTTEEDEVSFLTEASTKGTLFIYAVESSTGK